jgi:F-type H+-transporting ATPase subunit epsilon/F-type H+-transporting ATPase subunit delta|tara:strand:+ start:115 stop:504 length:390 start_codon:yes stop_codon:yes gene_type:complete
MSNKFTVEIITPDKSILKSETSEVTIPSYEGQMGILKDHIPLITFLRPGVISIENQETKKYFVEEGTVEFSNNNLLILTSTAKDLTELDQSSIGDLLNQAEKKFSDDNSTDKERYLLSYKINTLKEISR